MATMMIASIHLHITKRTERIKIDIKQTKKFARCESVYGKKWPTNSTVQNYQFIQSETETGLYVINIHRLLFICPSPKNRTKTFRANIM